MSEAEDVSCDDTNPRQQLNRFELNDLVRDLDLSKKASELLVSRLKEKNWLDGSANISFYRNRDQSFLPFPFLLKTAIWALQKYFGSSCTLRRYFL